MSACRFRTGERVEFSSMGNTRHVFHGELRRFLQHDRVAVLVDGEQRERVIQEARLRKTCVNFSGGGEVA